MRRMRRDREEGKPWRRVFEMGEMVETDEILRRRWCGRDWVIRRVFVDGWVDGRNQMNMGGLW